MERLFVRRIDLVLDASINPRAKTETDVSGLKAQILANGFIDPLWVRRTGKLFQVIDGSRRVAAFDALFREDLLPKHDGIPVDCFEVTEAQAREMALAANVVRLSLTPADEAEAFYKLKLAGLDEAAIAAHYALPLRRVRQRIAIGSLPAPILACLRAAKITIEACQAFTLTPSPERQLAVFEDLSKDPARSLSVHYISQALTGAGVDGSDPRAQFVSAESYEDAGGVVTRDLFSESVWFEDEALLARLCQEKIEATAKALKNEGWSFVEISPKRAYEFNWDKLTPKGKRKLSPEDEKLLDTLNAKLAQIDHDMARLKRQRLEDNADAAYADTAENNALCDVADRVIRDIEDLEAKPFTPAQKQKSGCVIACGGDITILRGLIKPAKSAAKTSPSPLAGEGGSRGTRETDEGAAAPEDTSQNYSDAIRADLALAAQAAVKLAMVTVKPAIAARMGLAARILAALDLSFDAPFELSCRHTQGGEAFAQIRGAALKPFGFASDDENDPDTQPTFAEVLAILETRTPEELTMIEAVLAADAFKLGVSNPDARDVFELIDPNMAAEGFSVDGAFLARLNRRQLEAILDEINPARQRMTGAKKPDLVSVTQGRATEAGWLPPPLRGPSYQGPGSNAWAQAHAQLLADKLAAE